MERRKMDTHIRGGEEIMSDINNDDVESSKQFRFTIIYYHCLLSDAWYLAGHFSGKFSDEVMKMAGHDIFPNHAASMRDISNDLTKRGIDEIYLSGKIILPISESVRRVVKLGGSSYQIAEVACKEVISCRKELEVDLKMKIWHVLPDTILTSREKANIIIKLIAQRTEEEPNSLVSTISLQLHHICYNVEKLIKCYAKLESEDEKTVMEEFHKFKERMNVTISYSKLFLPMTGDGKIVSQLSFSSMSQQSLPDVLIDIILSYVQLHIVDEDEFFRRLLKCDNKKFY